MAGKGFRPTLRAVNGIVLILALVASLMALGSIPATAQTPHDPGPTADLAQPETEASPSPAPKPSPTPTASAAEPTPPTAEQLEQTSDTSEAGAAGAETQSIDDRDAAKIPEHVKQRRAELALQIAGLRLDTKWAKGKEVPELRTAHSKTFMGDKPGQFTDKMYPSPIHFLEEDRWTEIDSNLGTAADGRRRAGRNSFGLSIAEQATDTKLVELDLGKGNSVGFSMQAARSAQAKVAGNRVEFAGVAKNTDLRLTSVAEGIKEELILHSADSPRTFTFPLVLEGVSASIDEKGGVSYKDGQDRVVAYTPPGIMSDAGDFSSGQPPAFSDGVSYELVEHGSGTALKVSVDDSWLAHPDRRWPVAVDPTVQTVNVFADDTFVVEDFDYDFSGWQQLYVGRWWDATAGRYWRANAYLHFDTTATWGKQYDTAIMYATELSSASCVPAPGPVYRTVLNNWQGSTIDYPGPAIDPAYKSNGTWWSGACNSQTRLGYWDVKPAMQLWGLGSGDGSVSMRPESDSPSHFKIYHSSEVGGSKRPFISALWSVSGYPFGTTELAQQVEPGIGEGPAKVKVQGWALDEDLKTTPVPVRINVRPAGSSDPFDIEVAADDNRPDVGNNYPAYGPNHGYSETVATDGHGSYQACVTGVNIGSNGANTDYPCHTLQVVNRPDVALNLTATRQDPSDPVHVTWDPPASNGGSAITGYKIEAKTEDGTVAASQTCAASCTSADMPGLGGLGDYWFEVSAQNVQGYGPAGVLAPAATTDATGLEDFYPYSSFDLGHGTAFANMANGNLVVQDADFDVPGQGLNLRLTRTYNSNQSDQAGPFGRGWTLGVAEGEGTGGLLQAAGTLDLGQVLTLSFGGDSFFSFIDADGTVHRFRKHNGVWQSPPGVNLTVDEGLLGFSYSLVRPDGVRYHFTDAGDGGYNLARITDRAGNALQFSYDGQANLTEITDGAGRQLRFLYGGPNGQLSRISFVSGADQLHTDYSYAGANQDRLVSVTRAPGTSDAVVTGYGYSADGLDFVEDGRDNRTSFATPAGRLQSITDRAGQPWTFSYTGGTCGPTQPATVAVCLTDPESKTSLWGTNAQGNLRSRRDAGDKDHTGADRLNTESFDWAGNRLTSHTDQAGNTTTYSYNGLGQIAGSVSTGSGDPTFTSTFDFQYPPLSPGVGEMTKATTAAGTAEQRVWDFTYDPAKGTLLSSEDPLDKVTKMTYYARGMLKSVEDANGKITTFGDTALDDGGYHASGQPHKITDPLGKVTSFAYDFLGFQETRKDRNGQTWTTDYDRRGNLLSSVTPATPAFPVGKTTTFCYDANDNQTLVIPPRGTSRVCTLDGTDGWSTKTTYDPRDLVSSTVTKPGDEVRKSTYAYYDDGALEEIVEPRSFDAAGGPDPDPDELQKVRYLRYPNNRLSGFIDEEDDQTDFLYAPHGLVSKVTDPEGGAGRHTMEYTYNRLGQVKIAQESGHGASMRYDYNLFGDMTKQTTPENTVTEFNPDKMGRPLTITDAMGNYTTNSYDNVGNLIELKQPTGDGAFITTNYFYTDRNEIDYETDPADAAHIVDYVYDDEGRQSFRHDRRGTVSPSTPLDSLPIERTTQQTFNADGTLAEKNATFPSGLAGHRSVFGYDADGNTTSIQTHKDGSASPNVSEITANYTSAGELNQWWETLYPPTGGAAVTKTGSNIFAQDGLLKSNTTDGQTSGSTWFLDGNEKTFTPYGGFGSFTSTYEDNGALEQMTFPNAAQLVQNYNLADMTTSRVFTNSSGTKLSAWESIVYDENNNRETETVTQAQPAGASPAVQSGSGSFGYDDLDRLTSFKHPFESTTAAYVLDDAGNVTSEPNTTFSFTDNRLITRTPALPELPSTYGYDHFGNQVSDTEIPLLPTTTTYDAASQTRRVTASDASWVEYNYDGLERMVSRRDSAGSTVMFFHDGLSEQIAVEYDSAKTPPESTRYLVDAFGVARGKLDIGNSTGRSYYITDPRGNVTQMIGASDQEVKAVFAYDPYGKDKAALSKKLTADWDSRLKFQMAPKDPKTGSYSLGSRLMDPRINRFVGSDNYVAAGANLGLQADPLTGNRYLYAGANPAGLIDDGHHPEKSVDKYSFQYSMPLGVTGVSAEDAMYALKNNPSAMFPFPIDCKGPIKLGGACKVVPLPFFRDWVDVSSVSSTSFTFTARTGHIEGENATIKFTTSTSKTGELILTVHAHGPKAHNPAGRAFMAMSRAVLPPIIWSGLAVKMSCIFRAECNPTGRIPARKLDVLTNPSPSSQLA